MKFALFFVLVAIATFVFRQVLTKRDQQKTMRSAARWLVPLAVASVTTVALIVFSLNFNGKVI